MRFMVHSSSRSTLRRTRASSFAPMCPGESQCLCQRFFSLRIKILLTTFNPWHGKNVACRQPRPTEWFYGLESSGSFLSWQHDGVKRKRLAALLFEQLRIELVALQQLVEFCAIALREARRLGNVALGDLEQAGEVFALEFLARFLERSQFRLLILYRLLRQR